MKSALGLCLGFLIAAMPVSAVAEQVGIVCGSVEHPDIWHVSIDVTGSEVGKFAIEETISGRPPETISGAAELVRDPANASDEGFRLSWTVGNGGIFIINRTTGELDDVEGPQHHVVKIGSCKKGVFKPIPADAPSGRKF